MPRMMLRGRDEPFVPCFTGKAHRFASRAIQDSPGRALAPEVVRTTLEGLYQSAAFDKAGFALYATYRRSGCRYRDWIAQFYTKSTGQSGWQAVFAGHPLLKLEMETLERRLGAVWSEVSGRIEQDADLIKRYFGMPGESRITAVDLTRSDPHDGHRTVGKIDFSCGATVFYKPRSSQIDLGWFAGPGQSGQFGNILFARTLALDGYGYQENLPGDASARLDHDAAAAAGEMLAIAWLLNSSDLHADNIVFQRRRVGVLDLETILTPSLKYNANHDYQWREANINASLFFCTDVSQISAHFKSSAFGSLLLGGAPKDKPFFAVTAQGEVRPAGLMQIAPPAPYLRPQAGLVHRMQTAFVNTCRNLEVRRSLLDFLDAIAGAELRFVPRDTSEYYKIQLELNLPKYLRDGEARERYVRQRLVEAHRFDKKIRGSETERLVADEMAQILQGDIPIFRFRADSLDLILGDGSALDFFSDSAVALARQKLLGATDQDTNEQAELISGTFGYRFDLPGRRLRCDRSEHDDPLALVAGRIIAEAIRPAQTPARWFSVATAVPPHGNIATFGDPSGFKGALGICRALESYLCYEAGPRIRDQVDEFLAGEAEKFTFIRAEKGSGVSSRIVGLEGLAGDLLAACHLLALDARRWVRLGGYVDALLDELEGVAPEVTELDVISGLSGAILGLTCAIGLCPAIEVKASAVRSVVADRFALLCVAGIKQGKRADGVPLMGDCGLAHGLSGALAAACALEQGTGGHPDAPHISRFLLMTLNDSYSSYGYWPDHRFKLAGKMNLSWCNGRVGLAKALTEKANMVPTYDPLIAEIWAQSQSDEVFENGTRFCCGASGVLDLTIDVAANSPRIIPREAIARLQERVLARCIEDFSKGVFDDAFEPHTANLYYGKSGVLYTALRSRHPDLPSLSAF